MIGSVDSNLSVLSANDLTLWFLISIAQGYPSKPHLLESQPYMASRYQDF